MDFKKYISELKRRNVFKAGLAYLVIAWLMAQVASIVLPAFNAPPYIMKVLLVVLGIGFPVWLVIAWIFEMTPQGIKKTDNIDKKTPKISQTNNRLNVIIIASLSIAIGLLLFNIFFNTSNNKSEAKESTEINEPINSVEKSIAVLPIKNLNQNEQLEYFSDGVTQEIIDELAKVHQFQISAFSSTVKYKKSDKNISEIAAELGVSLILSGSSRIYGDSVRLSIELVNPLSNTRIWNEQYDDVLSNAIKIQSDIAKQVAKELNIELSPAEKTDLAKINTNNHEAFDLLLRAKAEYVQLTEDGFINSIDMLNQALELDPEYAQAYTLLAWVHLLYGNAEITGDAENPDIIVSKALPLIEKAISLDPLNSDNYLIMGNLNIFFSNNLPEALQNINRALDMNSWPKVPTNYCICTAISVYTAIGDLDRAAELVKLSKQIDPTNKFVFSDEGVILLLKDKPEQAIYSFRQAVEFSDIPYFNYNLGWAYYFIEDYENALIYLDKAITGEAEPLGNALAYLSNTYLKMGNIKMSDHYRDLLIKRQSSGKANINIPLAIIASERGNTEEALHQLEKANKENDFGIAWYLNIDPVFDHLKNNSIFMDLIRNSGSERK